MWTLFGNLCFLFLQSVCQANEHMKDFRRDSDEFSSHFRRLSIHLHVSDNSAADEL